MPSAGRASRWYSTVGCDGPLNASSRLDERRRTVKTPPAGGKRGESSWCFGDGHARDRGHSCRRGQRLWFPVVISPGSVEVIGGLRCSGQDGAGCSNLCAVPCREPPPPWRNGHLAAERKRRPQQLPRVSSHRHGVSVPALVS